MTTPTTELTFADLSAQYDDELDDLREAFNDLSDWIRDEFGPDALDWNPAQVDDLTDEDMQRFATVQATRAAYEESAKGIQQRQHALDTLADEYGSDPFEIRMLTGQETMDIETDLRMTANQRGTDVQLLQAERKAQVVDAATVAAPEGVPTDDDGSPTPSACPNPLTLALHDQVEQLNNAGTVDFHAPGFGDGPQSAMSPSSGTPTTSKSSPAPSAPTDET